MQDQHQYPTSSCPRVPRGVRMALRMLWGCRGAVLGPCGSPVASIEVPRWEVQVYTHPPSDLTLG